ncbi:hypothetical protein F5884DRAFT_234109 [Xylogone sp. PMI_703]|nr:hypothetical protein F5884DRAFT_234109 [Xylogone sp. PMI_703]
MTMEGSCRRLGIQAPFRQASAGRGLRGIGEVSSDKSWSPPAQLRELSMKPAALPLPVSGPPCKLAGESSCQLQRAKFYFGDVMLQREKPARMENDDGVGSVQKSGSVSALSRVRPLARQKLVGHKDNRWRSGQQQQLVQLGTKGRVGRGWETCENLLRCTVPSSATSWATMRLMVLLIRHSHNFTQRTCAGRGVPEKSPC